jgi:hypothetical protein
MHHAAWSLARSIDGGGDAGVPLLLVCVCTCVWGGPPS